MLVSLLFLLVMPNKSTFKSQSTQSPFCISSLLIGLNTFPRGLSQRKFPTSYYSTVYGINSYPTEMTHSTGAQKLNEFVITIRAKISCIQSVWEYYLVFLVFYKFDREYDKV